eukprot:SAG25_NODE_916_length_4775_cov_8.131737_6_plen_26_part_01
MEQGVHSSKLGFRLVPNGQLLSRGGF